jgi:hypothetical protein
MRISEQHATHHSPSPAVWRLLSVTAVGLAVCAGAMALARNVPFTPDKRRGIESHESVIRVELLRVKDKGFIS